MFKLKSIVVSFIAFSLCQNIQAQSSYLFRNANAPIESRVNDLLHQLTLEEKISLLGHDAPAVSRLGIPYYNWWNEALHGIARAGEATVFPQAIGMSASFDDALLTQVASAISTEARAKYNLSTQMGRHLWYMGLTFWSPNINIFRDPRWGRGQETYGEDPYLTSRMGLAFVHGIQGDDPHYLKASACAKHFAVHSGPESERHGFNAIVSEKDLRETYLYAFKKLVDGGVASVMCAYNRVNGEPCCTSPSLLQNILHNEWGFKGQVVTDCWALDDILHRHKTFATREELTAAAIKEGVNLECGPMLQGDVQKAISKGLLTEADVNKALSENLRMQLRLGMYDSSSTNPYSQYGADSVHNEYHKELARKISAESMVLLKNDGVLPLAHDKYASMLVTGPNSSSLEPLMGNYHGVSGQMVSFLEGITKAAGPATAVQYDMGCSDQDTTHFGGIWASQNCEVTVAVIGLNPLLEGEEGDAFLSGTGDRTQLGLLPSHIALLKKLRAAHHKPIIAVVTSGSALDIAAIEPYADAIILAWYPGEQGGNALADILFGKVSPSGRLPLTFYQSIQDLPDFHDYHMKGRTYRYFGGKVQYPFGYGLSYTNFDYKWAQQPTDRYKAADSIRFSIKVQNTGSMDADEVVQAYVQYPAQTEGMPLKELKSFRRVNIKKGEASTVTLSIPVSELKKWDEPTHSWKLYKGKYTIAIGKNANEFLLQKNINL